MAIMGDRSFVSPSDGRLDVGTRESRRARSPEFEHFVNSSPGYREIMADGFPRRHFRDGAHHQ